MMRRHVSIMLDEEHVIRWELGFLALGLNIGRQMALQGITEWPELVHADPAHFGGWRLIFAWPES
jgi:hypothetical protein